MKLTGSDRPTGSDPEHHAWKSSPEPGGEIIARYLAGNHRQMTRLPVLRHRSEARYTHQNPTIQPPDGRRTDTSQCPPARKPATETDNRCMDWTTWWLWRGARTRSLPELGRENPQRPWYCVSRHGRVGRRQVFQSIQQTTRPQTGPDADDAGKTRYRRRLPPRHTGELYQPITHAGWSSPVARQAHNLKVTGSNPVPATKFSPMEIWPIPGTPRTHGRSTIRFLAGRPRVQSNHSA